MTESEYLKQNKRVTEYHRLAKKLSEKLDYLDVGLKNSESNISNYAPLSNERKSRLIRFARGLYAEERQFALSAFERAVADI